MENYFEPDNFRRWKTGETWHSEDPKIAFDSESEDEENTSKSLLFDSSTMYNFCGSETTEHIINKFDGFYKEMMSKVNTLKNAKVLKNRVLPEIVNLKDTKLFKDLKNTPKVQENIKQIQKLDEDMKNIILNYKTEKHQRLKIQQEMLNEITKGNIVPHEDSSIFIDLCEFEKYQEQHDGDEEKEDEKVTEVNKKVEFNSGSFIKRNIEVAKAGSMAMYSLTDEQKIKIEKLVSDDENNLRVIYEEYDDNYELSIEGFSLSDTDRLTMDRLDNKLNRKMFDMSMKNISKKYDLNNDFMLKQALKSIEDNIMKLKGADNIKDNKETFNINTINNLQYNALKSETNDCGTETVKNNSKSNSENVPVEERASEIDTLRNVRQNIRKFDNADWLDLPVNSPRDDISD